MSVPQSPQDVVPPGSETGVYYIPVSNLPFNANWQQLKDFVRQVCTVDHVEIFPKSTSGWIRVNGLDNFKAAFDQLNGGVFNGRALIADGRNENGPVKIRDIKLGPSKGGDSSEQGGSETPRLPDFGSGDTPPWLQTPQFDTLSLSNVSNNSYGSHTTTSMSPGLTYLRSPDQHYTYPGTSSYDMSSSYPQALPTSMPTSFGYTQAPSYYGYPPAPSNDQYSYGAGGASGSGSDYYGPYTDPPGMPPSTGLAPTAPPGGLVRTEQRGIHIREISRRVGQNTVDKFLRETAGDDANLILNITVPMDKDRNLRGWATMMFSTNDAALRMVTRLNKIEFKGRKLSAKVFKEGETIGSNQRQHHQKDGGKKDKNSKGGSLLKWSSSKEDSRKDKDKKDSKKSVVIAHGSSYVKGKR